MGEAGQQRLVAAHARVMFHIAGLRQPDDGLDEQVGLDLLSGPQRQLVVRPVDGAPRVKCHHPAPAQAGEFGPELRRRQPQGSEVVVDRQIDALEGTAHVVVVALLQEVSDTGVLAVRRAEDALGLRLAVGLPDVRYVERRQHHALGVAQRQAGAPTDRSRDGLRNIQRDRHGPERAVGQPHRFAHRLVVLPAQESAER